MTNPPRWLLALITLLFVLGNLLQFSASFTGTPDDTAIYRAQSQLPLSAMLFGPHPFVTSLIFRLSGGSTRTVSFVFFLLSASAWSALAWSVATTMRGPFKLVAFLVLLCLGLSPKITLWNAILASEGPSNAFFIGLLAAMLQVLRTRGATWTIATASGLVVLLGLTRDTNILPLSALGLACLVLWLRWRRRGLVVLAATAAGTVLLATFISERTERWKDHIVTNIGRRILPYPDRVQFFADRGMPLTPKVMRYRGHWSSEFSGDWSGFEPWLTQSGRAVYRDFVLTHLPEMAQEVTQDWQSALNPSLRLYQNQFRGDELRRRIAAQEDGSEDGFVAMTARALTLRTSWAWQSGYGLWASLVAATALVGLTFRRRRITVSVAFGLALCLFALPYWAACRVAEPMETERIVFGAALMLRLGLWLIVLDGLDALVAEQIRRDQGSA